MRRLLDSPAFRQSRPVLLTTFANKTGSIGLSLVTILLVERRAGTGEGTLVLSAMRAAMLAGTLGGGALSVRLGARRPALGALLLSAAGLGLLPLAGSVWALLPLVVAAQFADSTLNVLQRILITESVAEALHKEALGWLRVAHNFAQVLCFSAAALLSGFGTAPFFLFDAATSLAAFVLGLRLLPEPPPGPGGPRLSPAAAPEPGARRAFAGCALVLMGWSFLFELFLQGVSGRLEVLHPGEGLRRFSSLMVMNTVLCAALAVPAARRVARPDRAFLWGLALTAAGLFASGRWTHRPAALLAGMGLMTAGELLLAAVSQFTLMRLTPPGPRSHLHYSAGLTVMQCGRILGAAAAFPLLVHASSLVPFAAAVAVVYAAQCAVVAAIRGPLSRAGA